MKLTFLGAARGVTGSCYLIETGATRFLVDCGMFQGGREAPGRNRAAFAFDPRGIDFVLVTHAHIDHSGLLPRLGREGYGGPVFVTPATGELLDIMLRDSAHIQESDAQRSRGRGKARRAAPPPLYTSADVEALLGQLQTVAYDETFSPGEGIRIRFRNAGHILGSAILEVWVREDKREGGPEGAREGERERKLVFSGDLGQPGRPILPDPTVIEEADVLLVESTYGDRQHKNLAATLDEFVEAVDDALHRRGGNVIVPAFAVGRTQEILYYFHDLTRQHRLKGLTLFVDSPMASAVTELTHRHLAQFDEEAARLANWHATSKDIPTLRFVGTPDESRALNRITAGAVIISASGMCTAGRIKHHLRNNLPRRECTVLITGFQAQGTLGRRLVDGAKRVSIFGDEIPVRARIVTLGGFSAHADQAALMGWLRGFRRPPARTFVVHGEMLAASALSDLISRELGWTVDIPEPQQRVDLDIMGKGVL